MSERLNIDERPLDKEQDLVDLIEFVREQNEVFQRTSDIEARIENDQATEQTKKENLAERLYGQLKKQGRRVLEITAFMTALGLAGCYKADTENVSKSQTTENSSENLKEQKKNELITHEQNEEVLKETGIDVKSVAAKMGFDVEFEIPSATGVYILHVGQTHYVKEAENNSKIMAEIIASQMAIEKGLLALAERGEKEVFIEAKTLEHQRAYPNDLGYIYRSEVSAIRPTKGCFDELISLHDLHRSTLKSMEEDRNKGGEKADGEEDKKVNDYLITVAGNIYKKRAEELRKDLESRGEFDQRTQESFERAIKLFKPYGWYDAYDGHAEYVKGAAQKLENEGIIKTLAAETREGNEGAFKYDDDRKKASDPYFKFDFEHRPLEELFPLRKEYERVKTLDNKCTLDDREEIAISIIRENKLYRGGKIAIVVFGSAHDFRKMLEASNKAHPESQMGLIKLVSRQPASSYSSTVHP